MPKKSVSHKKKKAEFLDGDKWELPLKAFNLIVKKQRGEYLTKKQNEYLRKVRSK